MYLVFYYFFNCVCVCVIHYHRKSVILQLKSCIFANSFVYLCAALMWNIFSIKITFVQKHLPTVVNCNKNKTQKLKNTELSVTNTYVCSFL